MAERSGARREWPALPAGTRRGVHGEADHRSVRKPVMVVGQRASRFPAAELPEFIAGSEFLERWGDTGDPMTTCRQK